MKHYTFNPTKSAHEDVVRELARAKYHMMLQDPDLRLKVLRIARDILDDQIAEHEAFYQRNKETEYENQDMTSDELKLLYLHDSFESVEAMMCDYYYPDTSYPCEPCMPRIFSI